ncbi:MAG: HAMP domain-containing histidine kinase [Verrucomicrobia bacterium]|nr:HAMP domain-containing histidine kinase [Verrucomicrobiota bacterium]
MSTEHRRNRFSSSRFAPFVVILLTLAVLGGTLFLANWHFRNRIRDQIAGRDAQVLYALWLSHRFDDALKNKSGEVAETPAEQLEASLEISELPPLSGSLAIRLFDTNGNFIVAFPVHVSESRLASKEIEQLRSLRPVSRFLPAARLSDFSPAFSTADQRRTRPLLEITVPLHTRNEKRLLGMTQFVLDGESLAQELAALDHTQNLQALVAFLVSGSLVVFVLGLAFRQLQKVNRLLVERTQNLLQANQELSWAAKASAIGAVTSHLIHGLKNPLSGLQNFMVGRSAESAPASDTEWKLAASTTRRMQSLVNEVVRILREQNDTVRYEVTLGEIVQMVGSKMAPLSEVTGVHFQTRLRAQGALTNRDANLIILILENLIQNAIQATPRGKTTSLIIHSGGDQVICEVQDEGPGLPEHCRSNLFKPCQSSKEQGSGIGLTISKQLAKYIGADLVLKSTGPAGSVFILAMPATLLAEDSGASKQAVVSVP